jgi:hypothetical protein
VEPVYAQVGAIRKVPPLDDTEELGAVGGSDLPETGAVFFGKKPVNHVIHIYSSVSHQLSISPVKW